MDLISRKALLNDLCVDREEGTFCFTDSQAEAADKIIVYVTKRINAQPSAPAVPLDKLCEWLQYNHVTVPCDNDCENCVAFDGTGNIVECWKMVLTKWMEEAAEYNRPLTDEEISDYELEYITEYEVEETDEH